MTDHVVASAARSRSFGEILTDRTFGPFFFANALSNTGNWFQNVAAGIVVFDLTGSNTAVGAVSMLQFLATMLLTPWMGSVADRVNRKRMVLTGQAIGFGGAATLAIALFTSDTDRLGGPAIVFAATTIVGLGFAVTLPSLQALVPALVPRADLRTAITLGSMTFNIARGIGPVAAGVVVATFGPKWAFGINTISFVPIMVVLFFLSPTGQTTADATTNGTTRDGLRWIWRNKPVAAVVATTIVVGWTSDPFTTLMPALAEDLGGGDQTVGLLVGSFGSGAAITAPVSTKIRGVVGSNRMIPTGLCTTALGLTGLAISPVVSMSLVATFVAGAGFFLGVTGTNTELQQVLPEALRGRVMAWWAVAFLGCRPLASLVDGGIADLTNVRTSLAVSACVAAAAGIPLLIRGLTAEPEQPRKQNS